MHTTHRAQHRRILIIQIVITLWIGAIGWQLGWLQLTKHESLRARAEKQQQTSIELSPRRGVIYDRNGSEMARSAEVKSLYASPSQIGEPDWATDRLARALDLDRDALYERLTSAKVLVVVKRKLTPQEASRVEALGLPGLRFVNEMKRFYLSGSTAAHVLGFVDIDERGQGGVELEYDKLVRGVGGRLLLDVDALQRSYDHAFEEPVPGANIVLTIDTMIQHYAEKALAHAVRASRAKGGTVVIMRPSTGEILALANAPSFDPNSVSDSTEDQRCNRAVQLAFEPGSIFKVVTYGAALEEGLITPSTLIDCNRGEINLYGRVVHDGRYGVLSARQALAKSSNVAAIKIGQRLGYERLAAYVEAFGFGRRTGIELPAESRGLIRPVNEWGPTTIGSIPIGHEVGVTAVQAVAAFACIANDGERVQPYLVSRVTSSYGDTLEEHQSQRRRVLSAASASTLRSMLEDVVVKGTGKLAQIGGYRAAGKTGTAQKVDSSTGRYSNTRHVASFAGFAPADNPEIACIVSIDEPVGDHHGGDVAAPVFARVVVDTLHLMGVAPEGHSDGGLLVGHSQVYEAPASDFNEVVETRPAELADSRPALEIASKPTAGYDASKLRGGAVVPDLSGLGIRDAVAMCASRGLKLKATGEGLIVEQSPQPGTLVGQDAVCQVRLSPQPSRLRSENRVGRPRLGPARQGAH